MCQLAILIFSNLDPPKVTCLVYEGVPFHRALGNKFKKQGLRVPKVPNAVSQ